MRHKILLVIGLGIAALVWHAGASKADGRKLTQTSGLAGQKTVHYRKRETRVRGYYAMRGGYSYGTSDVTGSYRSWYPSLGIGAQSPGGPFDSGFFFDSGIRPLNNAPYLH
jgi:hypothetical protein